MKILIVRLGSLGDIVHALPVAAALRGRYPEAQIDWLASERYAAILDFVPILDRRIAVRSRRRTAGAPTVPDEEMAPGLPDREVAPGPRARRHAAEGGALTLVAAIRQLRAARYDIALDLQGLIKSAVLARASGAARVVGFAPDELRERAARFFYKETAPPAGKVHVVDKNLAALSALGIEHSPRRFAIEVPDSPVLDDVRARLAPASAGRFALINPGAAWPNKRWPPERFGDLAHALLERRGLSSIVTWGPGEQWLAAAVADASGGAAIPAPATDIGSFLALAGAASLVLSGDTGPLHLAAAVGAPIVALFGPTDPSRNGPWDPADICLSRFDACVCHYQRRCHRDTACIEDITLGDVLGAIDRRLAAATRA